MTTDHTLLIAMSPKITRIFQTLKKVVRRVRVLLNPPLLLLPIARIPREKNSRQELEITKTRAKETYFHTTTTVVSVSWLLRKMFPDDVLANALAKGHLPDLLIDPIRHEILCDPVTLEDGTICSKESITHWFGVCESQKLPLTSPLTGKKISPIFTENKPLKETLERYSRLLNRFKRVFLIGCTIRRSCHDSDKELQLNFSSINDDLLLSAHRLTRLFIPIQKIPMTIRDLIPKWEAPQIAVIGEISCGKSTLLERISLISLFPTGSNSNSSGDRERSGVDELELTHTCLPIHLKLRQSAHHSPPVLRVLDTKRKVQLGQAIVISSLENASTQISQLSREIHQKVSSSQKREQCDDESSSSSTLLSSSHQPKEGIYCQDRALIIHYHSPHVPSIDLIDLPGLLPLARPSQSSTSSSPSSVSSDYDAEWAKWRADRDELIQNFVLQNPHALFLAVVEANMKELGNSRTLALVQSLGIQVSSLSIPPSH
jgi:hypothetical protein